MLFNVFLFPRRIVFVCVLNWRVSAFVTHAILTGDCPCDSGLKVILVIFVKIYSDGKRE